MFSFVGPSIAGSASTRRTASWRRHRVIIRRVAKLDVRMGSNTSLERSDHLSQHKAMKRQDVLERERYIQVSRMGTSPAGPRFRRLRPRRLARERSTFTMKKASALERQGESRKDPASLARDVRYGVRVRILHFHFQYRDTTRNGLILRWL